ncbi:hypothetical protein PAXRUDRAFT_144277 [Paxillus rubicundulus Ve08.2h10]|uniref:Tyr recombinase domain-containing protein n=1 Tax=Paxillus rubicundulus Ve08.2h10 TaxID=930991 RepID=A0A0D0E787_9AGAM|nr:hypothetical protein PAXRUDRAFT_144277 [Paxillus rubicundulus Ve08.2h10]
MPGHWPLCPQRCQPSRPPLPRYISPLTSSSPETPHPPSKTITLKAPTRPSHSHCLVSALNWGTATTLLAQPASSSSSSLVQPTKPSKKPRTTPADTNPLLRPSPLRPMCKARDHLLLWAPIKPRSTPDSKTTLSQNDIQHIYDIIAHAWADSMKEMYRSGLLAFHIFCDNQSIPELEHTPTISSIISAFISTLAGSYSGSTISNYINSIRAWHTIHGLDWALNNMETDALLKVAMLLAPPQSKRPPHEPYTMDLLVSICNHLDLSSPLHTAVFACLTSAFYATACMGELTTKTLLSFNPLSHVKPSDIQMECDCQGNLITNIHLPKLKSAPNGKDINWARQDGLSDPQAVLENHQGINCPPSNGPLFTYHNGKAHKPLTKGKFLSVLTSALKAARAGPCKHWGHGIRLGLTLEYLLRNVPFNVVKVKGRWASDTFLIYLRQHAQILAPYMQAQPSLHESFLRLTLPPVR